MSEAGDVDLNSLNWIDPAHPVLEINPQELTFTIVLGDANQPKSRIHLINKSSNYVIFKTRATHPKRYLAGPSVGILAPGSDLVIKVVMDPSQDDSAVAGVKRKDRFVVLSYSVGPTPIDARQIAKYWELLIARHKPKESKHAYHEMVFKCNVMTETRPRSMADLSANSPSISFESTMPLNLADFRDIQSISTSIPSQTNEPEPKPESPVIPMPSHVLQHTLSESTLDLQQSSNKTPHRHSKSLINSLPQTLLKTNISASMVEETVRNESKDSASNNLNVILQSKAQTSSSRKPSFDAAAGTSITVPSGKFEEMTKKLEDYEQMILAYNQQLNLRQDLEEQVSRLKSENERMKLQMESLNRTIANIQESKIGSSDEIGIDRSQQVMRQRFKVQDTLPEIKSGGSLMHMEAPRSGGISLLHVAGLALLFFIIGRIW